MKDKKYNYTQLGMLFGIFIGGAIGVLLFVFTEDPLAFTITGIGLVIGLIIGAAKDRQEKTDQDN
ncbi:MAG: hypothetical protein ACNA70_08860 [Brevefilum sp.]